MLIYIILLLVLGIHAADENQVKTVLIITPSGPIKGVRTKFEETDTEVTEFRGIRYGKPPVGPLRFRKPEPIGKWTEPQDATNFGAACVQSSMIFSPDSVRPKISEDCLFLNIYVPGQPNLNRKSSVMVWIHGGGLMMGYGHEYNGARIATQGNVIVVTINYRLGVFGFFSLGHPASVGNYGVWDQKLALQWIHDNIAAFGGNPESVTIFGESAGGWSVNVQSLIPSNKGLFQRAIAQSGAFDFGRTFALSREQLKRYTDILSNGTGCFQQDLFELTDCLRQISFDDLFKASTPIPEITNQFITTSSNGPVIDGELFTQNPFILLQDSSSEVSQFFQSIDFIAGVTSNEGSLLRLLHNPAWEKYYGYNISEGVSSRMACEGIIDPYVKEYLNDDDDKRHKLCEYYSSDGSIAEQGLRVSHCLGELLVVTPLIRMLEFHWKVGGKTWQYKFSMLSPSPLGGPPPSWFRGSGHADELIFMFSDLLMVNPNKISLNEEEKQLSRNLINYWTSFAKYGNPSYDVTLIPWKQFDMKDRSYLNFDSHITTEDFMFKDTMELWSDIFQDYEYKSHKRNTRDEL